MRTVFPEPVGAPVCRRSKRKLFVSERRRRRRGKQREKKKEKDKRAVGKRARTKRANVEKNCAHSQATNEISVFTTNSNISLCMPLKYLCSFVRAKARARLLVSLILKRRTTKAENAETKRKRNRARARRKERSRYRDHQNATGNQETRSEVSLAALRPLLRPFLLARVRVLPFLFTDKRNTRATY